MRRCTTNHNSDGTTILRFAPGSTTPQQLFQLEPASDKDASRFRRVTSLLVAGDNTVWVTYGASVFRWREGDEKPEEFSTYLVGEEPSLLVACQPIDLD